MKIEDRSRSVTVHLDKKNGVYTVAAVTDPWGEDARDWVTDEHVAQYERRANGTCSINELIELFSQVGRYHMPEEKYSFEWHVKVCSHMPAFANYKVVCRHGHWALEARLPYGERSLFVDGGLDSHTHFIVGAYCLAPTHVAEVVTDTWVEDCGCCRDHSFGYYPVYHPPSGRRHLK